MLEKDYKYRDLFGLIGIKGSSIGKQHLVMWIESGCGER